MGFFDWPPFGEKTFVGFIKAVTWVCIISAAVLIFMALANG